MKKVYLAGQIGGLSYDEASIWRQIATNDLKEANIEAYSPLRFKEFLRKEGILSTQPYTESPLANQRGILTRDHWDCMSADLILVYLYDAKVISMGTVMEIAFGHAYRKPIVAVMESGNIHEHAMVNEAIDFRVSNLYEALDIVRAILNPS